MKMPVYYISIEGNTRHFVTQMDNLFNNVQPHEVSDQSDLFPIPYKYFAFVPTYVRGAQFDAGHPADNSSLPHQIEEMDTLTMNDELGYHHNYQNCLGLIGSGNRNFGIDCYCWTARHYHRKYHIPLIDDYEIRGTLEDENRINRRMVQIWNLDTHQELPFKANVKGNARLKKLESKYGKDLLGKDL